MKVANGITKDSHHSEHANSTKTIVSKIDTFGIDITHINNILKEMSHVYAKIIKRNYFKYQYTSIVVFDKFGEDNEIINQIELPITLSIAHNITKSGIETINNHWTLENRIQSAEAQESVWNFQRINTKK